MQKRKQKRRVKAGAAVRLNKPVHAPLPMLQAEGIGAGGDLPFRVELPSRRWLELAAGNGAASG